MAKTSSKRQFPIGWLTIRNGLTEKFLLALFKDDIGVSRTRETTTIPVWDQPSTADGFFVDFEFRPKDFPHNGIQVTVPKDQVVSILKFQSEKDAEKIGFVR